MGDDDETLSVDEVDVSVINLYVISHSGVLLFALRPPDVASPVLFAGFLTGILSMAKEIGLLNEDSPNVLACGDLYLRMKSLGGLHFLIHVTDRASVRHVDRLLDICADEFHRRYGDMIEKWDGDTGEFSHFGDHLYQRLESGRCPESLEEVAYAFARLEPVVEYLKCRPKT